MIAAAEQNIAPAESLQERVEELKQTVSASKLNTWQSCRLKFFFRYVLRIKRSQSAARYVGSMVHRVLQSWNLARWRKTSVDMAALRQTFDEKWAEEQKEQTITWDEGEQNDKQTSWRLVETYLRQTPIPTNERPEGVEVSVEADLAKHGLPILIGVIDLVRQGGRIVDYKTSGQTPNSEKIAHLNETQLSCYAILYREAAERRETGLELHTLIKLKTPKLVVSCAEPMTEQQQTRLFRIIDSYLNGLDRQDWIPSPSPMSCSCCEYFNECRRWH